MPGRPDAPSREPATKWSAACWNGWWRRSADDAAWRDSRLEAGGHDLPRRGGGAPPPDRPAESGVTPARWIRRWKACCRSVWDRRRASPNTFRSCPSGTPGRWSWELRRTLRTRRAGSFGRNRWGLWIRPGLMKLFDGFGGRSIRSRRWCRRCGWKAAASTNGRGKEKRFRGGPGAVKIYELVRTGMEREGNRLRIDFEVLCSKGTYVRTLCVDIGAWLGYPAHMSRLVRVQSGPFFLQDTLTLEELREVARRGAWGDVLVSPDAALGHFPLLVVPSSPGREC